MAVVILVIVELIVRQIPAERLIPYGTLGRGEFTVVRDHLAQFGPADIVVLGSSRGREAFVMPLMRERLSEHFGAQVQVQNYSCASARGYTLLYIARRILSSDHRPAMIIVGVEPRLLTRSDNLFEQVATQWDFSDWLSQLSPHGLDVIRILPDLVVARAEVYCATVRYREALANYVSFNQSHPQRTSQVVGDYTVWHREQGTVSLVSRPVSDERVQRYVDRILKGRHFVIDEKSAHGLSELARICRQSNVPVVFVEIPISDLLKRHYPLNAYETVYRTFQHIAETEQVPLITVDELSLSLSDADFLEQSHLNLSGASKLSTQIIKSVVIPRLEAVHFGSPSNARN